MKAEQVKEVVGFVSEFLYSMGVFALATAAVIFSAAAATHWMVIPLLKKVGWL